MKRLTDSVRRQITGVVLAGGRGSRFAGKDKGLIDMLGRPLIEHVLATLTPQVGRVMINANRNTDVYGRQGCQIVPDRHEGYQGPLAGMASGLHFAASEYVVFVPCDSPLIGDDLVARLYDACVDSGSQVAIPDDGNRTHPVFALIDRSLAGSLEKFLADGERKIDRWMSRHRMITVDFSDAPERFSNINTEADLAAAERVLMSDADTGS